MEFFPRVVSWNLTYRCNLKCSHCYLDASFTPDEGELDTEESLRLIDDIASFSPGAMLVLSGGEPLLREDIFELARHASSRGLMVVLGTNGTLLDSAAAKKLLECGVRGVGISLDSPTPEYHDSYRGVKGSWQQALNGIESCKKAGLAFQVQTTVLQGNYNQIPHMIEFASRLGATVFDLFFLVCAGRGQNLSDLKPEQYESLLSLLRDSQQKYISMLLRPRCAPYFVRMLNQKESQRGFGYAAGCLAGVFYCRVTPEGELTPCPYLPLNLGNVREKGFGHLWLNSPQLIEMRMGGLKGKCGRCEFSSLCRGCRARAYFTQGSLLEEDPWCLYHPATTTGVTTGSSEQGSSESETPEWSTDALSRLNRVPIFLRPMVKKATEAHARRKGLCTITPELLSEMRPHKVT